MPRNILFIMSDQQRWDTLGALGCSHVLTPNLDALARRGQVFRHACAQGALCGPSRASLVTGQYVHAHGAEQNETWPDETHPNWVAALRDGGWHTVNIGKMHTAPIDLPCGFNERLVVENKNYMQGIMGPPDAYDRYLAEHGMTRPALRYFEEVPGWFDRLGAIEWPYDEALYPDNFIGRHTVDYLERYDYQRPLFCWAGFIGPHDPYDVPASVLARYDGIDIPDPVCFPGEADTKPAEHREGMKGMDGWRQFAAIWWSRATPERVRAMRRHYYANITCIDDWVGRIVDTLDRKGQLDDTLFVFTSDHGDTLGDHDNVYKFTTHYDSVVRVPLVLAGPGVPAAGIRDAQVQLIDLGPTLLELAGLPPCPAMHGRSLTPLLHGEVDELHDAVFSEHLPRRLMVRTRAWKLVFYPGKPYGELYHLAEDPDELRNLYDVPAHHATRLRLQDRLLQWMVETRR
jgi:arylsulfatase A-like enzyme